MSKVTIVTAMFRPLNTLVITSPRPPSKGYVLAAQCLELLFMMFAYGSAL